MRVYILKIYIFTRYFESQIKCYRSFIVKYYLYFIGSNETKLINVSNLKISVVEKKNFFFI